MSSRRAANAGALRQKLTQVGFGQHRHAGLLRLRDLRRPGLLADHEARRLLRDRVRHLRALRLQRLPRRLAREALERAGDDVRLAAERALDRPVLLVDLEVQAEIAELLDESAVLVVGEPL